MTATQLRTLTLPELLALSKEAHEGLFGPFADGDDVRLSRALHRAAEIHRRLAHLY